MFRIFPYWFWKIMVGLWSLALMLVVYELIFETPAWKHLTLSFLYISGIFWVAKHFGWISWNKNKSNN